ncbi:MAG TPA: S4 domain-containing protein, partial [Burkholderiales bacterium]|nr:S4 domain-containing protein [Burkholderiales bacterium]
MNNFNKNKVNFYKVTEKDENMRLDNLLIKILIGVPKSHIYKIIRSGEIKVNQKKSIVNAKIKFGDIIRIPPIKISEKKPTKNIPIAIFPV